MKRYSMYFVAGCCVILGAVLFIQAALVPVKAFLSPYLLDHAWEKTLKNGGEGVRPWPWMDAVPVGQLSFSPKVSQAKAPCANGKKREAWRHVILGGTHGTAMAFSPVWHEKSAALEEGSGASILSAHNDTHFAALEESCLGDIYELQDRFGQAQRFIVRAFHVADEPELYIPNNLSQGGRKYLILSTCYPFSATGALRTQKRFVVFLEALYP